MTPVTEQTDAAAGEAPAAVFALEQMRKRRDFLAAARGRVARRSGFVLQGRPRSPDEEADADAVRIGFTCSKKVGNAVARNRAKRRLREIARLDLPGLARPGWDYVLIGRRDGTAALPFERLRADLAAAVAEVHG